jgi:phage terminase large subunit GpA-like protein
MVEKINSNLLLEDILNLDPIYFIENTRKVKGKPFKILGTGREYLVDLYRYACVGARKEGKPMVIVKGRQVEFTEAALNISLYYMKNFSNFTVLHAFPRKEQVSRYSRERLQFALKDSQLDENKKPKLMSLKSHEPGAADTISAVAFNNQNTYYMFSAWGDGDALRGIPADMLSRDEFQDWSESSIANTASCLDASDYKIEFSFGTPKSAGAPFEKLWLSSDMRYYHLKCTSCGHLFKITLDNYKYGFMVECTKCHHLQDKRIAMVGGQWIPTKDSKRCDRTGFHVSQLLSPRITREQINLRQAEYSDARFKNEVLGEFYSGAGRPLDEATVVARCAEPYKDLDFSPVIFAPRETYMGLDWGGRNDQKDKGAYTVMTMLSKQSDQYFIEYSERITTPDLEKQVKYIADMARNYNSVSIVADIGFGQYQVQALQKIFKNRVKSCFYATNIKNKMKYDKETWQLAIDRNAFLEELIDLVQRGRIAFPWKKPEKLDWFIRQICNTELRYAERTGNIVRVYEKADHSFPNDALHSLNYAYLASVVHLGENAMGFLQNSKVGLGMPRPISTSFSGKPTSIGNNYGAMQFIKRNF